MHLKLLSQSLLHYLMLTAMPLEALIGTYAMRRGKKKGGVLFPGAFSLRRVEEHYKPFLNLYKASRELQDPMVKTHRNTNRHPVTFHILLLLVF